MKIILRQDQESLGKRGEMVEVAPGYARNFLFPRGLALEATEKSRKRFEEEKKREAAYKKKEKREAEGLAKRLSEASCTIPVQVGQDDKLYGSVTSQDIAEALAREGMEIDKRKITLKEPMKALGVYHIPVKLHSDVAVEVKVWVVKK